MKKIAALILILGLAGWLAADKKFEFVDKEEIQKTLRFQTVEGRMKFSLDNVIGSLTVTGTDGREVRLQAIKTIEARDQESLDRARREVVLDIVEEGSSVTVYVDGPFRGCDRDGRRRVRSEDRGYRVSYDFEVMIPRTADVDLRTVTDGRIRVEGLEGSFDVRHVNGGITMEDIHGSGSARTVNGGVTVHFSRNPLSDCSFRTVNGDLDLTFPDDLAADLSLKTMMGKAYSNFEFVPIPTAVRVESDEQWKFIVRDGGRPYGIRVGQGGPEISMETLNGDLIIKKK